ncbi:hypothetical protein D3C78_1607370 [compost metagenome]
MEKNTPHYELAVIKAEVRRLGRRAFTRSSAESGDLLGFWQDVYHTHSQDLEIYIKATYRPAGGAPVISFKEKNP